MRSGLGLNVTGGEIAQGLPALGATIGSIIPGIGTAIGGLVGEIGSLFVNTQPSNFAEWMYFNADGSYSHTKGDKPNSNTEGLAAAFQSAWSQALAKLLAMGYQFNAPPFAIEIGQRDPTTLYTNGAKSGGTSLGGPGDANTALQAGLNWLLGHATHAPAQSPSYSGSQSPVGLPPPPPPGSYHDYQTQAAYGYLPPPAGISTPVLIGGGLLGIGLLFALMRGN